MRGLANSLLDLIFAPICLGCDGAIRPGDTARLICRQCRGRIRQVPAPTCPRCGAPRLRTAREAGPTCIECQDWPDRLHTVRSACLLRPPADRIVHQLKYRGWKALAEPMAEFMARVELPREVCDEGANVVVPVPTTTVRYRERGYNQAGLLAEAYARRTRRRVARLLERTTAASSQTRLRPAARGANVAGGFRLADVVDTHPRGRHPLLVDDVLTTGATVTECARTLLDAGAERVSVITFARTPETRRLMDNE